MTYQIVDNSSEKMQKAISHFKEDLNTIRTGMANANMNCW